MARLDVTHLSKNFGTTPVLRGVSFHVESGELVAILGASGSGKTTLLRLIAGFERAEQGEIRLGHEIITGMAAEQRGIGYVAQEGALFPHLCVADNITFGLRRAERRARHRVAELLRLVGLPEDYARRGPQALSGGEQQRVALARALAPAPKLVLLDEPFSALDAGLRADTRAAVAAAIRASGATAILVTHDQEEALSMGSRVGVLQHGQLAQMSTPDVLYHQPVSPYVADFVGDAVFCAGLAEGGLVHCALGTLPLAATGLAGAVTVMIRPEQIRLDAGQAGVPAVVQEMVFYGRDAVVRLGLKAALGETVLARVFSRNLPRPGAEVGLAVEGRVVAYPAPGLPAGVEEAVV